MQTIGFPIPTKENERRRALLPEHLGAVRRPGQLLFQKGYGAPMGIQDELYEAAGAKVGDRASVCACPIICNPKPISDEEYLHSGATLFGWIHAVQGRMMTDALLRHGMTAIAWEDMYESQRHSFWRNNEISGEAAVAHAYLMYGSVPYGAKAAVIGRGNVARGAIRALERAGCMVTIYDRRTVGLLRSELPRYDVVINAVLWDVFRTDHLIYLEDLPRMKPGALLLDISCDEHMGIESSRATTIEDPVYWESGVMHYCVDHTPSLYYRSASESISQVVCRFVDQLIEGQPGEVLEKATVIRDGRIIDDRITRFQKRS